MARLLGLCGIPLSPHGPQPHWGMDRQLGLHGIPLSPHAPALLGHGSTVGSPRNSSEPPWPQPHWGMDRLFGLCGIPLSPMTPSPINDCWVSAEFLRPPILGRGRGALPPPASATYISAFRVMCETA